MSHTNKTLELQFFQYSSYRLDLNKTKFDFHEVIEPEKHDILISNQIH